MIEDLPDILHRLIGQKDHLQVRFPEPDISVPALAFNVPFPRLEIVLEGQLNEQGLPLAASTLTTLQVLYAGGEVDAAAVDRSGHYPEHSVWSAETGIQYSALGRKKPAHGKTERFPAWAAREFLPVAEPE